MESFLLCLRRGDVLWHEVVVAVEVQRPELLQASVASVNAVCVPRLRLLHRAEEHLVKAQGVCSVLLDNHVWIDDIVHRL